MPGYLAPQLTPLARQSAWQDALTARFARDRKSHSMETRASFQRDHRDYANPDAMALVAESRERSEQWDVETRGNVVRGRTVLSGGAETGRETLFSESVVNGRAARNRTSADPAAERVLNLRASVVVYLPCDGKV
jgi:hypothetical protein